MGKIANTKLEHSWVHHNPLALRAAQTMFDRLSKLENGMSYREFYDNLGNEFNFSTNEQHLIVRFMFHNNMLFENIYKGVYFAKCPPI